LLAPAGAGAGTTVGSTFTPNGLVCPDNFFALQTTSAPADSDYVVPHAGVLTSWSHVSSSSPPTALKLEVGRATNLAEQFLTVGNSAAKNPAASTTSTYTDISIPVQAGDFLGLHSTGAFKDCGVLSSGYEVHYLGADPAPGDLVGPPTFPSGLRLDISATLEPDCDADGLGDETEDADTSSCNPPPANTATPTGQPVGAHKKCKKKKHKKHSASAAKKKCAKKKRR
jgi:hypothetical protein